MWALVRLRTSTASTIAVVTLVAASIGGLGTTGRAQAKPGARGGGLPQPAARTYDVTLVTGDKVHVSGPDGQQVATVTPAAREGGRVPRFLIRQAAGHLSVVPDDVLPLLPRRLDPALFDVTQLVREGYADSASRSLPLLVTYRKDVTLLPATTQVRRLDSIDAAGVIAAKKDTRRLGAAILKLARAEHAGRAKRGTAAAGPLGGVEKIWLDRKVRAGLDRSVPQINAPAAWAAGYEGKGITVAVLDSGVDSDHPDLTGKVSDARNFTPSPDADDHYGHGTHVASIIAGSGAASDGGYKGVAPGATLVNGKVLDDTGTGLLSWVIDGMEWASAGEDAEIVNMSLASDMPGGPLTEAVGELTRRHGTLFVIAAGNGSCDRCVGSPADAEEGLTVGAVDGDDRLADFSSRGPAPTDNAIKPDITAPGVGIVAARAEGTSLGPVVGDSYTRLNGTSMATPHVAGSAALMLQAHPGSSAEELKALLMGTAKANGSNTLDEQGAGRVDVAGALASPVVAASGSLDFGFFAWPHADRPSVTRKVTYRNRTDAPVRLDLDVRDQKGAPSAGLSVTPATVTIPAKGSADVDVVLDTAAAPTKLIRAVLNARVAGGATLRSLIGAEIEPQKFELRVKGIARDGRPANGLFSVLNVDTGEVAAQRLWPGDPSAPCTDEPYAGNACIRVPAGTYSVSGLIYTMPSHHDSTVYGTPLNVTLVGDPEFTVDFDTALVLDARTAREVTISTPDHPTKRNLGAAEQLGWHRAPERGAAMSDTYTSFPGSQHEERFFVQPTKQVTKGTFATYTKWWLEAPAITMRVAGRPEITLDPQYYRPDWFSPLSEQFPRLDGKARLPVADAGEGRAADLEGRDLTGALALVRRSDDITVADQSNNASGAGAKFVVVYNDQPGVNVEPGGQVPESKLTVPTVFISHEQGRRLLGALSDGRVEVEATGVTRSPYVYQLVYPEGGRVSTDQHHVARTATLARIDSGFRSQLSSDVDITEIWPSWQPWDEYAIAYQRSVIGAPRSVTHYVSTDPKTRWNHRAAMPEVPYSNNWPVERPHIWFATPNQSTYRPGQRVYEDWFKQPLVPGTSQVKAVRRYRDMMEVYLLGFVDPAGRGSIAHSDELEHGIRTDFTMYENDALLWHTTAAVDSGNTPGGVIHLKPGPATYRFVYDIRNNATWAKLSTRTHTEWTFTSQRPPGEEEAVMPLLLVGYDTPLDMQNRALPPSDRKGPSLLNLTVRHQPGAADIPVTALSLAVSYDDGDTWADIRKLRPTGNGNYEAKLNLPHKGGGFVSLRVNAKDAQGNTITQTITRAYALPRR